MYLQGDEGAEEMADKRARRHPSAINLEVPVQQEGLGAGEARERADASLVAAHAPSQPSQLTATSRLGVGSCGSGSACGVTAYDRMRLQGLGQMEVTAASASFRCGTEGMQGGIPPSQGTVSDTRGAVVEWGGQLQPISASRIG